MNAFLDDPAVQKIGWALLHFIWQGALLAAILLLTNRLTKSARIRYATSCAVMLAMPAIFVATILRTEQQPAPVTLVSYTEPPDISSGTNPGGHLTGHATIVASTPIAAPAHDLSTIPGWIACLWLIGVAALSIFTAAGWLRIRQLTRSGAEPANSPWPEAMESLKRRLKISKPVRLCMSAIAEVPTVIGWLRPCILIPISVVTSLDESQLRAILAHELAHIRRHDYLINLLQNAIETLLFYHPAVWWVSRQIRQEREHCCDDLAVEACGDVMLYARALTQLEEQRSHHTEPALAATGGDLLARIRRLTGQRDNRGPGRIAGSIAAATTAALVVAAVIGISHTPAIHAQSPPSKSTQATPTAPFDTAQLEPAPVAKPAPDPAPRLEFEVASIRPAEPLPSAGQGRGGGDGSAAFRCGVQRIKMDADLVTYRCVDLRGLIQFAYGITHPSLLTGPPWLMGQRFDIEAKLPQGAIKAQVPAMFQSLLEDRFKLAIRRSPQEQPVNAITIDKGGLKLTEASPDAPIPTADPDAPPCPPQSLNCSPSLRNVGGEPATVTPLSPGIQRYSSESIGTALWTQLPGDPKLRIEAPNITIRGLASLLQTMSFQPVVDMTGLNGRYSITLETYVDRRALVNQAIAESPAAQAAGPQGPNAAIDAALQSADGDYQAAFQKALQNALLKFGLRLQQSKAPVETLIVDHVEKLPGDN